MVGWYEPLVVAEQFATLLGRPCRVARLRPCRVARLRPAVEQAAAHAERTGMVAAQDPRAVRDQILIDRDHRVRLRVVGAAVCEGTAQLEGVRVIRAQHSTVHGDQVLIRHGGRRRVARFDPVAAPSGWQGPTFEDGELAQLVAAAATRGAAWASCPLPDPELSTDSGPSG
ncbi:hypothetical protein OG698_01485 [Streptomyces sp. NBC_01003]|nr:hypothetical protein OG698_01485 [Streptomyces sp. NBC_01003]